MSAKDTAATLRAAFSVALGTDDPAQLALDGFTPPTPEERAEAVQTIARILADLALATPGDAFAGFEAALGRALEPEERARLVDVMHENGGALGADDVIRMLDPGASITTLHPKTKALLKWPDTVGVPNAFDRAPVFGNAPRGAGAFRASGRELGGYVWGLVGGSGPLPVDCLLLLGGMHDLWLAAGHPARGAVRTSARRLARFLYDGKIGGYQVEHSKALGHLMAETIVTCDAPMPDGTFKRVDTWALLSRFYTDPDTDDVVFILSDAQRQAAEEGTLTYLSSPAFRRLLKRNKQASRLWCYFESHDFPARADGWTLTYATLAEVLCIDHWKTARNLRRTIGEALAALSDEDARYTFEVAASRTKPGEKTVRIRRAPAALAGCVDYGAGCVDEGAEAVDYGAEVRRLGCRVEAKTGTLGGSLGGSLVDKELRGEAAHPVDIFVSTYPSTEGEDEARRLFAKLSDKDRTEAVAAAGHVAAFVAEHPKAAPWMPRLDTFLRKRRFADWRDGPPASVAARYAPAGHKRDACPECETDLTYDEAGEHCPRCDWRPA